MPELIKLKPKLGGYIILDSKGQKKEGSPTIFLNEIILSGVEFIQLKCPYNPKLSAGSLDEQNKQDVIDEAVRRMCEDENYLSVRDIRVRHEREEDKTYLETTAMYFVKG